MRFMGFVIIALVLSGCAASGPKYVDFAHSIPELEVGKSRVFMLRPSFMLGSAQSPDIEIQDQNPARIIGDLPNGSFTYFDLEPGYSTIATIRGGMLAWEDKKFVHGQHFDPNEEYYLHIKIGNPAGILINSAVFGMHFRNEPFVITPIVSTPEAKRMLEDLSYQKVGID